MMKSDDDDDDNDDIKKDIENCPVNADCRQNADETEEKNDEEGESCHLSVAWLLLNFSFETIILPLWWWGRVWVTFETEEKNDDKEDESSHRCMTLDYVTSAVPTIFPFSPF